VDVDEILMIHRVGISYSHVYFDELQNWSNSGCPDRMRATLRSVEGVPCQLICTANPGGVGHAWVKRRYVMPAPSGFLSTLAPMAWPGEPLRCAVH
jgi:hypothetical protein